MTDRIHSLTVVLQKGMREDDAERIAEAIALLGGVVKVSKGVADLAHYAAVEQAKHDLRIKLRELIA